VRMERTQRKANRLEKYDYSQSGAYFVTICTQGRRWNLSKIVVGTPVPGCPPEPRVELLPHGIVAERYIRQMDAFYDDLTVDQFVIMPDHIHLLLSVHDTDGHPRTGVPTKRTSRIARFVGTFKRFCNKEYGENIWQGRFYDHIIRDQQDYHEIWEYIEANPQKWINKQQGRG